MSFPINWKKLVTNSYDVVSTSHNILYLEKLNEYSSNIPPGIFCSVFEYTDDSDFETLLKSIPTRSSKEVASIIAELICETSISNNLTGFADNNTILEEKILNAFFRYIKPSKVPTLLSEYLYNYGIYRRFSNDFNEAKAIEITRDFTNLMYNSDLENVLCFHSGSAWGDWFDKWSCCDLSAILLNRKERLIWILCVTDSD